MIQRRTVKLNASTCFGMAFLGLLAIVPLFATTFTLLELFEDDANGVEGLAGATFLLVSPEGTNVYTLGETDDAITVFNRDPLDNGREGGFPGKMVFIATHLNGLNGVFGLDGPSWAAMSPDGHHVYTTARVDDTLVVFRRDTETGALAFVETHRNAVAGVFGLDSASSVAVSPEGNHVLVTGADDDTLVLFSRDATTDSLAFLTLYQDESNGIDGLDGARSVQFHPDGDLIYVLGTFDDALTVFSRDATVDSLTFVETHTNGLAGLGSFTRPTNMILTPDGRHVYVTSQVDRSISLFERPQGESKLVPQFTLLADSDPLADFGTPTVMAITPDGNTLFVADALNNTIGVFQRDRMTGALSMIQTISSNPLAPNALEQLSSLAVTPDGRNLLAVSFSTGSLVSIAIDL